jgi:hypothetical protein
VEDLVDERGEERCASGGRHGETNERHQRQAIHELNTVEHLDLCFELLVSVSKVVDEVRGSPFVDTVFYIELYVDIATMARPPFYSRSTNSASTHITCSRSWRSGCVGIRVAPPY